MHESVAVVAVNAQLFGIILAACDTLSWECWILQDIFGQLRLVGLKMLVILFPSRLEPRIYTISVVAPSLLIQVIEFVSLGSPK